MRWNKALILVGIFCCYFADTIAQIENPGIFQKAPQPDSSSLRKQIEEAEKLMKADPDSAIRQLEVIFYNSLSYEFYFGMGAARLYQGNAYLQKSNYEMALLKYGETLGYLIKSSKGVRSVPSVLNNIANVYHQLNDYENAVKYYYKAIAFADSLQPPANVDYIYQNLAGILVDLNQSHEKIFNYLKIAENFALERKNYSNLSKNYINRGYAYKNVGYPDSAMVSFRIAYNIALQHQLVQSQYVALLNIGAIHNSKAEFEKAIACFNKAQSLQADISPFFKNRLYKDKGIAYLRLGNYSEAEKYLKKAIAGSQRNNQAGIVLYIHKDLAELYNKKKEYDKAYQHAILYASLKDSIASKEIINRVNTLESKYSVAKKNEELIRKELMIQKQDNRIKYKNLLIAFSAFCLLGLTVFILVSNRQKKKIHLKNLENIKLQQKTDLLQAHINGEEKERSRIARELHDGLGGLSSALSLNIHLLKHEDDPAENEKIYNSIEQIAEHLHSEIKKTAHNLTPDILIQYSLPESILLYCRQVSDASKVDIVVQSIGRFEKIPSELRLVIYRIIQELVNNIAKHAQATKALVQLVEQENAIVITVEDDGVGYDTSKIQKGMGLKNIEARVKVLNGHFTFESAPGEGTTTIIEFYN